MESPLKQFICRQLRTRSLSADAIRTVYRRLILIHVIAAVAAVLPTASAALPGGTWFKIRTNGVPQSPINLTTGASGDLWMTSESPNESGAWRWPDGGQLLQITGDSRANDLGRSVNLEEKSELAGQDVVFAADDSSGNVWYALAQGGVRVQKADSSWVRFDTSQSAPRKLEDNAMSRIRFGPGGTTLLIGPKGAYVVNSSLQITQQRTGILYNNDFINDVLIDSSGRFWVTTNRGPHRGTDINAYEHVSTLYPGNPNVPSTEVPVTRIEEDANGHIWMLSNQYGGEGIFCLTSADAWEHYTTASVPEIGNAAADDLLAVPNGDMWFGLRYANGVAQFRRGSGWTKISMASLGIDSYDATSLAFAGGNIWFTSGYNPSVPGNGTGVHKLHLDGSGNFSGHETFTYTLNSTSVPSNRCRAVAGDKSGNVWFGAYDRPAISRRKANGTWETFDGTAGPFTMNFGVVAIGVDSANIIYFYSFNSTPFAFNADTETWVTLPTPSSGSFGYPYGLYIDAQDEKWFYNSDGVMRLSADNTTWTHYSTSGPGAGLPSQYVDYGVRRDRYDNIWFGTRAGLAMLHSDNTTWTVFPTASGSTKAYLDDNGEVWNQAGLKFDYDTLSWFNPADKSAWLNRNLPFANGFIFKGPDPSRAKGVILNLTGSPVTDVDEDLLALGSDGSVYQGQWAGSSDLGVLGYEQPPDALAISPNSRSHSAKASWGNQIAVTASRAWTATTASSWITITSGASGGGDGTVTYAITTNASATADPRAGLIVIKSLDGLTKSFSVTQSGMLSAPAGELLGNASFDTAAGANWQTDPSVDRGVMFGVGGEANMHVDGFTGTLLWQDLSIPNAGGMAFRVGAVLHSGSYPPGKSVAVYLEYLDGDGNPQRLLVLEPENRDINGAPSSSYFENQVTLPFDAQQVTGLSIDRLGPGEFTAENLTFTAIGYAIPITSLAQLEAIGNETDYPLSGNYVMVTDIDAFSTAFEDAGNGFLPIGRGGATPPPFTGSFDGQDYSIFGLTIHRPTLDSVGLFRILGSSAAVRNLAMKGGHITGQDDVGAIAGMNDGGSVLRCSSSADISALVNGGGLLGSNHSGLIQECLGNGEVVGRSAGGAPAGAIGGVAGMNMGMIRDCISAGSVSAQDHYSLGGLLGTNLGLGQVLRCYSAGEVAGTGNSNAGGLVGYASDTDFVQSSFWDASTSGQGASSGGSGQTTAAMMQQATFESAGWDFASVWNIQEDVSYPSLSALEIQLLPPLTITQQPADIAGGLGGSVQFTVQHAGGLGPFAYQWQEDQIDLTGGGRYTGTDTDSLTVDSLTGADSGRKYRVIITDSKLRTIASLEGTLTIQPAPDAVTLAPTYVASTRAIVAGEVNSFGVPTEATFLWGTSAAALSNTTTATPSPVTVGGTTSVTAELTNLIPGKTYYYRIKAESTTGSTLGSILNFKALAAFPPVVKTLAPSGVDYHTATLNGTVNARNFDTTVTFEYGPTTAYGSSATAIPSPVTGDSTTPVSAVVMGLQPHTKYHFRVKGSSDRGTANGADLTFTTPNHAPEAFDDTFALLPSAKRSIDVLDNDSDSDSDPLRILSFTQPPASVGRVTKVGSDLFFTPSATFTGGSFSYTVSDGFGGKDTATVTLTLASASLNSAVMMPLVANGGQHTVDIQTTAIWAVVETLSWVTGTPVTGLGDATITLTVNPNTSRTARTGTVKIGGQAYVITQAGVLAPQISVPAMIPAGIVGGDYSLTVPTVNPPVIYTVSGLPSGLKINQSTGLISGKPLKQGDFNVVVRARNAAGTSGPISFGIHVNDLPDEFEGTFTALVDRDANQADEMGGQFELTSSPTGALSGKLRLGKAVVAVKGQLDVPLSGDATEQFVITRKGQPSIQVDLTITETEGLVNGTITELVAGGPSVPIKGARHPWTKTSQATDFVGYFTSTLRHPFLDPYLPQGSGYLTMTVTSLGKANWAGKLADGTAFTASSYLWADGSCPVYLSLYRGLGSLHGTTAITSPMPPSTLRVLGGAISWIKRPQTTRAYASGFGTLNLTVTGGEYVRPPLGQIVLGLTDPGAGLTNAMITFASGGVEDADLFPDLSQDFRITTVHKCIMPAVNSGNPANVKITSLSPATGVFSGSFVLKDPNPTRLETRTTTFQGVILPGQNMGDGFFLLSELSVPPTPASKMPQNSGRVTFAPSP